MGCELWKEGGVSGLESRATAYRFIMSAMSFISASTAAIFSADEGCGRPNPRNDMLGGGIGRCAGVFDCGVEG